MGKVLDGFPWWSQADDPDPTTGRPDLAWATDCGEEVVSIALSGHRHVYTDAADLRRELGKSPMDGRTSGRDLAALAERNKLAAVHDASAVGSVKYLLKVGVDRGQSAAILGTWVNRQTLHWVLGIGYGNDALLAMDPWSGRLLAYRWRVVQSLATGDVVRFGP